MYFEQPPKNFDSVELNDQLINLTSWSLIKVSGIKAESFLQGQLTFDIKRVTDETFSFAALCNHQGRVLALFYVFKQLADFFILLPKNIMDRTIAHLNKYALFSKVNLEDVAHDYLI